MAGSAPFKSVFVNAGHFMSSFFETCDSASPSFSNLPTMAKRGFFDADELASFGENGLFIQTLSTWCIEYNAFLVRYPISTANRIRITVRYGVLGALVTRMEYSGWVPSSEDGRLSNGHTAVVHLVEAKANDLWFDWFNIAIKLEPSDPKMVRALCSLLKAIGGFVIELRFQSKLETRQVIIQTVVTQCVNLEHLNLEYCNLTSRNVAPLLHALRSGTLGCTLVRLYLSCNELTDSDVVALADFLKSFERKPALNILFLGSNSQITAIGINALGDALQINKTLVYLAVPAESEPHQMQETKSDYITARRNLIASFHGERLVVPLSLRCKLACLSGIFRSSLSVSGELKSLDIWTLASIFAFAANRIRRQIF
ncbi:hypothetical protein FI667_g10464, partial [Globisporangium splendens]